MRTEARCAVMTEQDKTIMHALATQVLKRISQIEVSKSYITLSWCEQQVYSYYWDMKFWMRESTGEEVTLPSEQDIKAAAVLIANLMF